MIDRFAEVTGDHQWIHVDVERAKAEMPGGKTIAHGYLLLSLLPKLGAGVYKVAWASRTLNYGSDKVRIIKFRRRKHHMKRKGHRQHFTEIETTGIAG